MVLDEELLERARQARERLIDLQQEAEMAQVGYQHTIRRLNAAGASLREIADALGLSYQRVHQIVDVGSGKGAMKECRMETGCSFCGVQRSEARKLIAGPGVFICDGCVDLAVEVLAEGEAANRRTRLVGTDPGNPKARCSFCGRKRDRAGDMAEAPDRPPLPLRKRSSFARRAEAVRICGDCIGLCEEILSEQRESSP
jgi:ClpX C4-type zinc finger protein